MTVTVSTPCAEFLCDIGDMLRLFLGDVQVTEVTQGADYAHIIEENAGTVTDIWVSGSHTAKRCRPVPAGKEVVVRRIRKRQVKQVLYELLKEITGLRPPWGSLTGIRPTRLLYEGLDMGLTPEEAKARVMREFDVSEDRAGLLCDIERMQRGLRVPPEDSFDLYIGIPFCRTRCSYCSFSSGEIGRNRKLVEPYEIGRAHV